MENRTVLYLKSIFLTKPTLSISHLFRMDIVFPVLPIEKTQYRTLEEEIILLLKENADNFGAKRQQKDYRSNRKIKLAVRNHPLLCKFHK